jgi:glycosyltransferase involved in cell wall biosynthesis
MTVEVAAIIPTLDRADVLSTTLRSVLRQRDVELEAIVADDGSSDGTSEVGVWLDCARAWLPVR